MNPKADQLRSQILSLVAEYHQAAFAKRPFVPGESSIPYAGRVFDEREIRNLVDASLDFWLTTGRFAERFEREFAQWMEVRHCLLVNSGSSANLVALAALTSPRLGERRLRPGDEVITVAAGFPTTLNPILQNGLVPVFVDVTLPTYNVDTSQLEAALSPRTRAMIFAHTLGNPFDVSAVASFARKHDLWLVEDCCDAVGSTYFGRKTGTFGDLATVSFYPAHHMTMGEGGAVLTNTPLLHTIAESFRDWGRDCWCEPGCDNTCGKRFGWQLGELPCGYDHKFTYSHIGYNLKLTDMQAAVGVAQLEKLDGFVEARRRNFRALREGLAGLEEFFVLPEATNGAEPSWFGFPVAVRAGAPFTRNQVTHYLETRKIATRLLFGGNLVRQPAYRDSQYRVVGSLSQTDIVMNQVFWIGVYPGIQGQILDYMLETMKALPESVGAVAS
ncbi:MAG: lipopolysaccharide biosynthesis protein RfbH [Bryobacteraceae bacterium]|jgi:CDP-6-deoxy-D-xylo-4-hexulose-3-dehydrase